MRKLIYIIVFIFMVISLYPVDEFQIEKEKIKKNLALKIKGSDSDLSRISDIMARFYWIINKSPLITITPDIIKVNQFGELDISIDRKLIILWKDPSNITNNMLLITADVIPHLISPKAMNRWVRVNVFTGVNTMVFDQAKRSYAAIGVGIGVLDIKNFELDISTQYSGYFSLCLGLGYRISHYIAPTVGLSMGSDGRIGFYLGLATKVW